MNVVLISWHYYGSRRRATFHQLADAYEQLGCDVTFVTAPVSWLSRAAGDARFAYPLRAEANRPIRVTEKITSYVLFTPLHVAGTGSRVGDRMTGRALRWLYEHSGLGALQTILSRADLVVMESTPAIVLAPRVRAAAPNARLVYRVSDDLSMLSVHPEVVRAEREQVGCFDFVSLAHDHFHERYAPVPVRYHPNGVPKHLLDAPSASPFGHGRHAVWVGAWLLDTRFLDHASERVPECTFHVIGPIPKTFDRPNVVWHGEMAYEDTIPFLQHADAGLSAYSAQTRARDTAGVTGYLADGLKSMQYRYLGLPIVAPDFLRTDRPHHFFYTPGDPDSAEAALRAALHAGRRPDLGSDVPSALNLAREIAGPMILDRDATSGDHHRLSV